MSTHSSGTSARSVGVAWLHLTVAAILLAVLLDALSGAWSTSSAASLARSATALVAPQSGIVYTVNMTGDAAGVGLGTRCDTVIDIIQPGDQCTLRAALRATNNVGTGATITFNIPLSDPGCDPTTGRCTINLTTALPDITALVDIVGPGAAKLTVRRNAGGAFRIFTVPGSTDVSFSGLTITQGDPGINNIGGGIFTGDGTVNIASCVISSNTAHGGGGIASGFNNTATVNITNSLISGNVANGTTGIFGGGGILAISGMVNVIQSVLFANSVPGTQGGGVKNISSALRISNSTITGNQAPGGRGVGIYGNAAVKSTIIAGNGQGGDFFNGAYTSEGFNLIGTRDAGFAQSTDQVSNFPRLSNVSIFGVTVAAQPLCTSPAFDKGSKAGLAFSTDIRGFPFARTVEDLDIPNATVDDGTDIGAVERPLCSDAQFTFTVNKTTDADDVNPGDGICDIDSSVAGSQCTLHAAIQESNAQQQDPNQFLNNLINFAIPASQPNCDPSTGACVINLTRELPHVTANLTIQGPSSDRLIIRRQTGEYRILTVTTGTVDMVTISGVTISNGLTQDDGGGIALITSGALFQTTLTVIGSRVSDNFAGNSGGGISSSTPNSTLNISNSTISNNTATNSGGGIASGGNGTLNISDSTINNNLADARNNGVGGGGIAFRGGLGEGILSVTNSTISGNVSAKHGGGLLTVVGARVTLTGSRFVGNVADTDFEAYGGGLLLIPDFNSSSKAFNVTNCQFIGNRAKRGGGAAFGLGTDGMMTVTASTFSNNITTQNRGGGIYFEFGKLNIINSAINNNQGRVFAGRNPSGGGILVDNQESTLSKPTLNVINSTISGNDGDTGGSPNGAIEQIRGTLNISNSTILGGLYFSNSFVTVAVKSSILSDVNYPLPSGNFNLVGGDLKLAPLADNGGPTETHALLAGSPAIDKGTSNGLLGMLSTDQRGTGFPRTFDDPNVSNASGGDGTDIGAFEVETAAPNPTPTPTPTPTATPTPTPTATPTPTPASIQFSAATYNKSESGPSTNITVTRTGDTSGAAAVDFRTGNNSYVPCNVVNGATAQNCDFIISSGTLNFAAGQTSRSFPIIIIDDLYVEGNETLSLTLSNPFGAVLGAQSTATLTISDNDSATPATNPLDDAQYFVRQHYYDFLGRLPDDGGLAYWTNEIAQCGSNTTCLNNKGIDVSNAFFYEQEYQQTASYVFLLYRAAFGNDQPFPNPDFFDPNLSASLHADAKKLPRYLSFVRDRVQVVGGSELAQTQSALANAFVQRPEFVTKYPLSLATAAQFVDALLATIRNDTGAELISQRDTLIGHFNTGGRGLVMFHLANDYWNGCNRLPGSPPAPCVPVGYGTAVDNRAFIDAEYNRSFVYSQYSGYLRRDGDISGFMFWLNEVSKAPPRNLAKQHAMVCAQITSAEYQSRFSSVVTRSNAQCAP